ncbi:Transcriptional regulatory protein YehT [Planctomycetes bacterium Pla163]|uniref:Transcriptional regulatory protein YehT n=1 Tax=Rohdeia mirabilis TaxID=2528008 RepID=A0A518D3V3_9BACT|nr:Transcriptional regulatory protein YehT [Planctomycetes bacterium Pla163]
MNEISKDPVDDTTADAQNEPIRCVIVDDEPMGRESVRFALANDAEVEIVGEASDGDEALEVIRREVPDVVVLDIHMPGRTGLEVLGALEPDERPLVIFATAYDQYAVEAFESNAVDYLLKPFDDDRLARAFTKVKGHLRREQAFEANERLTKLLAELAANESVAALGADTHPATDAAPESPLETITIHREGQVQIVPVDDVRFIQAADQYVEIFTDAGPQLMREAMSRLEQQLDRARFMRIHRSYIVAMDQVRLMESRPGGTARVRLVDGRWLPVARTRVASLRRRLG